MASSDDSKNIVVIGGGIIGCTTAYFLTRHPSYDPSKHSITLLEASTIAGGASGKAGGLLALWAYPSNIVPLSYRLHAELAKEHNGAERWGYRRVHCAHVDAKRRPAPKQQQHKQQHGNGAAKSNGNATEKDSISLQKRSEAALRTLQAAGVPEDLDWISPDAVSHYSEMGTPDDTAQVHPYHFTTSMAALASEAGVKIITGARATSINQSSSPSQPAVESITYTTNPDESGTPTTTTLPATTAILAAGPWTANLLPSAPISGLRAHSVTIRPSRPVSAYALFTSISGGGSAHTAPEIYARPFNEVYACGEGDQLVPLPETTAHVETDLSRCADIVASVGAVSDELRDGEVTARQACYLPVCGEGGPYIGECREMSGLVLAAGHSCWGIQNAPGTGKLVSEIVFGGRAVSAKMGRLEPKGGMYGM